MDLIYVLETNLCSGKSIECFCGAFAIPCVFCWLFANNLETLKKKKSYDNT